MFKEVLHGDQLDDDLIWAMWSYCPALRQLNVPLPVILTANFLCVKGYRLKTRHHSAVTSQIDVTDFSLPTMQITDWSNIEKIEKVALALKPAVDVLWNATGFERSFSYQVNGAWRGQ